MAKEKKSKAVQHAHGASCCNVLSSLAMAAEAVKAHHACCDEQEDTDGGDCCQEHLGKLLDMMEEQITCLRETCGVKKEE